MFGEGTLVIQCGEFLLNEEYQILGMISPDSMVARWAKEKSIPFLHPKDDMLSFLGQKPFDYLFSIVNNIVIPTAVLALPCRYAINYHDAPLPKYAGINATSWAILSGEKIHGVSWHVMTDHH